MVKYGHDIIAWRKRAMMRSKMPYAPVGMTHIGDARSRRRGLSRDYIEAESPRARRQAVPVYVAPAMTRAVIWPLLFDATANIARGARRRNGGEIIGR